MMVVQISLNASANDSDVSDLRPNPQNDHKKNQKPIHQIISIPSH